MGEITYPVTVKDKQLMFCPTCHQARVIYIERYDGTDRICCGVCQRIIRSEKSPSGV